MRGAFRIFRVFTVSGSNRWFRKSDRPALLWPALGDRDNSPEDYSISTVTCFAGQTTASKQADHWQRTPDAPGQFGACNVWSSIITHFTVPGWWGRRNSRRFAQEMWGNGPKLEISLGWYRIQEPLKPGKTKKSTKKLQNPPLPACPTPPPQKKTLQNYKKWPENDHFCTFSGFFLGGGGGQTGNGGFCNFSYFFSYSRLEGFLYSAPPHSDRNPKLACKCLGDRKPRTIPTRNHHQVVFWGGWCANCGNLRRRQHTRHH